MNRNFRVVRYVMQDVAWYYIEEQHRFLFFKWWIVIGAYLNKELAIQEADDLKDASRDGEVIYQV